MWRFCDRAQFLIPLNWHRRLVPLRESKQGARHCSVWVDFVRHHCDRNVLITGICVHLRSLTPHGEAGWRKNLRRICAYLRQKSCKCPKKWT